ncbi:MAG: EAL domain-containing protein [Christensenellales bacterium]|jgi:diguanylate cyclase (GGDEF)-like protein
MEYDVILSIIFYLCGCFYMVFSAALVANYVNNKINWLFVSLISSLAIWAFSHAISISASTAEISAYWRSFSAFGWGSFSSFLLHFILVITKTANRLKERKMLLMLYLPVLINIVLFGPYGLFFDKQYNMVRTDFGWVNMPPMFAARIWLNLYYVVFSVASVVLLINWWRKLKTNTTEEQQARRFILSIMVYLLLEGVVDLIPDVFGKMSFPQLTVIFLLVPTIMLFRRLKESGELKKFRKTFLLEGPSEDITDDRARLFKNVTVIFEIGAAISFLIGYFGMKKPLENELLLAGSILLLAVFIRFIPHITKKHTTQNILFLGVAVLAMMFFVIQDANIGALTTWALYILFLLFSIILDDKTSVFIFTVFNIVIQLVLSFLYPKVTVIIDINEYVTRIFIIILSYITVYYLTNEYTLKTKNYKRIAREQEVLETISSSFIVINTENAKETIGRMFEMAVEILAFNQAFIFQFSENHEDATILSMYVDDVEGESFPYCPGLTFKVNDLSMFKSLIEEKTTIVCEDTKNISFDEAGNQIEYFKSRGVDSFFAVPIMVEDQIEGVLVAEYNYQIDDISIVESRLNILKIIANILGDGRKKTLYEERLYNFAFFDEVTKLANSNMLVKRLEQSINNRKWPEKIALINIELDNLRMINDTFGHQIGEQVVKKSALLLEKQLGGCCNISRTGDGEFVVVLPNVKSRKQIEECINKLLASFSRPILTDTGIEALFVVVYMGISLYPDDGRDVDTLLKNVDLARFEAKNNNEKVVFYTKRMENHISENTLLMNRLFNSLENEEFFIEFQPQINCNTEKTAGIEALLRWTNDGEIIPPDRFIPILEQTGLIYDVGLWVLKQTLKEHNRLISKGFPPIRVSVNLSVVQFQNEDLILDFTKIIKENNVNPKYIELEITESFFFKNPKEIIEKLYEFKELGVNIAIDDFGKGYSSLNRLNVVPFDRIKIDKAIIDHMDLSKNKAPVTESIIQLARSFMVGVTAEGVETKEQADFLISIDCDEIQGYYYSRPLSVEALEEFLENERFN